MFPRFIFTRHPHNPSVLLIQSQENSTTRELEHAKTSTPWDKEGAKNTDYCGQGAWQRFWWKKSGSIFTRTGEQRQFFSFLHNFQQLVNQDPFPHTFQSNYTQKKKKKKWYLKFKNKEKNIHNILVIFCNVHIIRISQGLSRAHKIFIPEHLLHCSDT